MKARPVRLSPSDLEALRYYLRSEYMTLEEVIARLRREAPPNIKMEAGSALHSILEHSGNEVLDWREQDGKRFVFTLDATMTIPPIRELKTEYEMVVDGQPVVVACVTDVLDGITCWDHKYSEKFEPENYVDSLQWRVYLRVFRCHRFIYNVFSGRQNKDGDWLVNDLNQFTCWRYPDMNRDIDIAIGEFLEFAREHLPERFEQ